MIAKTWKLVCFFTNEKIISLKVIVNFRNKNLKWNANLGQDALKKRKDCVDLNTANLPFPIILVLLNQTISKWESKGLQKIKLYVALDKDALLFPWESVHISINSRLSLLFLPIVFIKKRQSQFYHQGKIILAYLIIYV